MTRKIKAADLLVTLRNKHGPSSGCESEPILREADENSLARFGPGRSVMNTEN